MKIVTEQVYPDEPCHGYFCGPKGDRMLEQVFVIRGDAIACYERDFGKADTFMYIPPMMVPSFGENTVAQLQDMGERHRNDPRWAKRILELKQGSTLFQDAIRQEEMRHEIIRNRSVIGPFQTTQRNGYDRTANWRRWSDERAVRTGRKQF